MEKYSTFEFIKSLFNEVIFINYFDQTLRNYAFYHQDDILLNNFDNAEPLSIAQSCVRTDNYRKEIQVAIQRDIKKDFEKISSILNEAVIDNNKKIPKEFISLIKSEIAGFKKEYIKCSWLNNKQYIVDDLEKFEKDLDAKYLLENDSPSSKILKHASKLKWNSGPANLCTLFYELTKLTTKEGLPYLEAPQKQLEEFIFNNFVDENSEPLSLGSIKVYIDPHKKKAKRNRIDSNLIVKKFNKSNN